MNNRRIINIKAILIGFISDYVASTVFALLLTLLISLIITGKGYGDDELDRVATSIAKGIPFCLFLIIVSLGFTMMGGYISARLAGQGELFHAGAVGVINVIMGLFFLSLHFTWYNVIAFILIIPAAIIGGNIAKAHRLNNTGKVPKLPDE